MQSEIPQLDVITAIGDSDSEDYVAQLLFTQGWNIIYRAFDMATLLDYLNKRSAQLRTVIVFRKDLPNFDEMKLGDLHSPTLTIISLDGIPISSHQIMTHIRSQLRLPLITSPRNEITSTSSISDHDVFLVTGTVGAPGRTTIALNLALGLNLPIYDLDFKNPAISYLIERSDLPLSLLKLDGEKPREFTPRENSVLDLGALPPIGEMVNDRRWHAALLNSVFESGGKLIFVCKAEGLSLIRLSKFISDFPILLRKIPIFYLLNLAGNSREERAMEKKFLKLVTGEKCMVISQDHRMANFSKTGNKVIGKLVDLIQ